jgi:predicted transcriptional regulator
MYEMYVRNKIDRGLNAADEGKLVSHEDVKKGFHKNEASDISRLTFKTWEII